MCNHTRLEIDPNKPRDLPGDARCERCKVPLPYRLVAYQWVKVGSGKNGTRREAISNP